MRLGYCLVFAFVVAALLPCRSRADGHLTFAPDPDGNSCYVADPGPNQVVTVYVVARNMTGVTGFRFAAPTPSNSGLTYVTDQSTFFTIGNSQSDVAVSFGACETGTFVVMQILFYRPESAGTCAFYTTSPGAIYSDCTFAEHPLPVIGVMLNSDGTCIQARNIAPADGATNVPLATTLTWTPGYTCYLYGSQLYFGMNPNPPEVASYPVSPFSVGPLHPGTKYYWRVADPGAGPVWSFTTTNIVATQPSTWGAIKALYR